MAKDQSKFFESKKPWSDVKDELLGCYLTVYFQKILRTYHPVGYVDCFAGKGLFNDGKPGSPLIALETASDALRRSQTRNKSLQLTFIEAVHASALSTNIRKHKEARHLGVPTRVIDGRFENEIQAIISDSRGENLFLYIDPYGLRQLSHELIASFAAPSWRLSSVELLINLNSFGLVREGCRSLRVGYDADPALAETDAEFEDELDTRPTVRGGLLDSVMGGSDWRPIIEAFRSGLIDGLTAEQQFADLYRDKLLETYRYVLSMPIRKSFGHQPKYRMVHVSNHPDGCVLMARNMLKRSENLYFHLEGYRNPTLFDIDVDVEGERCDPTYVIELMRELVSQLSVFTDATDVEARFYSRYGVVCGHDVIRDAWIALEEKDLLAVRREPEFTSTGKPSRFWESSPKRKLWLASASERRSEP